MVGFIIVVVAIIVIVVVAKKNKRKKAIEELMFSNAYDLAVKIKNELEKQKGYKFGEPSTYYGDWAYGIFSSFLHEIEDADLDATDFDLSTLYIVFSVHRNGSDDNKYRCRAMIANGKRVWGIENDNIGIFVYSEEEAPEMPDYIRIAAEVISSSGYGQCRQVQ